jgi:hypothetical protein
VSTVAGVPGQAGLSEGPLPASLNQPSGVAVLPHGVVAVSDAAENVVVLIR